MNITNNKAKPNKQPTISKKQQAYEYIRKQILDETYTPGSRIVIDRIARELNLSSIPVREAIHQLEADGYIQVIPYSGAVVQLMNETDFQETMGVLAILDGAATAFASKTMTAQDIEELENRNKAMKEALYNFEFEQFGELNREFHEFFYEKCGNAYLIDRLRQTWQRLSQIRKAVFSFVPNRAKEAVREHEELIELIKASAPPEEIEKFIRQHKLNMLTAFQRRKDTLR
ncbi:MAG: GntR family transcriptional regulator [Negativicutes bacterium]|nr:GntR family transcriptional regulator [Negativicutes bacterium]